MTAAREPAACLAHARVVSRALPIDPDADRAAEEALARYLARQPRRKLVARGPAE